MVLEPGRDLRERPVLGYKQPLTILDFVWGIKYRRFRTWNKTRFQHFLSEMNKTNLPLASLCVFWAYFIVSGFLCPDYYYLHKTKSRHHTVLGRRFELVDSKAVCGPKIHPIADFFGQR